jgi:hypothetical protein
MGEGNYIKERQKKDKNERFFALPKLQTFQN